MLLAVNYLLFYFSCGPLDVFQVGINIATMENNMKSTIPLGDLELFRIGLGTNRLTNTKEAHELLKFAQTQGINFFDTANIYQDGESEKSIAQALRPYAKNLCIATKGGYRKDGLDLYIPEGNPQKLKENLENSLRRLQVEQIYLYQLHRVDPLVPMAESLGALNELQSAGKIRYIGLSEVTVSQIEEAMKIVSIQSVQNRYNVLERNHEAVVDFCHNHGIIFIPFFPLGSSRHLFSSGVVEILRDIAKQYERTPEQIALAWLLQRSPYMLPIPGTLSKHHLLDNVNSIALNLSAGDFARIKAFKELPHPLVAS